MRKLYCSINDGLYAYHRWRFSQESVKQEKIIESVLKEARFKQIEMIKQISRQKNSQSNQQG